MAGTTLYVGGRFTAIDRRQRTNIASVGTRTGAATSWRPGADDEVETIAVSRSTIYAGGDVYEVEEDGSILVFAVLDTPHGEIAASNPQPNGSVDALAHLGSRVYLGGAFTQIGGRARNRVAALSAKTGAVVAWNPTANAAVDALAAAGSRIYAGGAFTRIGRAARPGVAALDAVSGRASPLEPAGQRRCQGLRGVRLAHLRRRNVTRIAAARRYLAALDVATGVASGWNPHPKFRGDCDPRGDALGCEIGPGILSLAVWRSTLICRRSTRVDRRQGSFESRRARNRKWQGDPWNPNLYAVTYALVATPSTLLAGTDDGVSAFSLRAGGPNPWTPGIESVHALTISHSRTYAGGALTEAGYSTGFAVFGVPRAPQTAPTGLG